MDLSVHKHMIQKPLFSTLNFTTFPGQISESRYNDRMTIEYVLLLLGSLPPESWRLLILGLPSVSLPSRGI